jgi:hypothetical protein
MRHGFYAAYQHSGGSDWRRVAGFPPMLYSTHTVAPVLAATGARVTSVSCLGVEDREGDGVFGEDANLWSNPYSNQVALHRLSNGGVHRVVEFRRAGLRRPGTHIGLFLGTAATYEFAFSRHYLHRSDPDGEMHVEDVSALLNAPELEAARGRPGFDDDVGNARVEGGIASPILARRALPRELRGIPTTHRGTPPYLVDDFARAVATGSLPPNHAWDAARATLPGLASHESALRDGEVVAVPDHGDPPAGSVLLEEPGTRA